VNSKNNSGRQKGSNDAEFDNVTPNTPLRLEAAARLAFPDGSMKLAGLRREIARGRLAYEVIANKHYTTLADIEDMRKLCRVSIKVRRPASGTAPSPMPSGPSEMSPQERLQARLDRGRGVKARRAPILLKKPR
jgi:hypothetical protein